MNIPVIELKDVTLRLGGRNVLQGVNLRLDEGERLVVLGQSGGGKSTLLRLILGILRPNAGSVKFRGHEIPSLSRRRLNLVRQRIGMVYQYSALISSLSVRDNLALGLEELTDTPADEINRLVKEKLALVGMEGTEEKLPATLSGGMRKRVSLARALMMKPELLLYDEPSAGLDPIISAVIDDLMISTAEQTGTSCIIVTHELDSAFKVATRMAMLNEGEVIADGTPDEFRDHPDPRVYSFMQGQPSALKNLGADI